MLRHFALFLLLAGMASAQARPISRQAQVDKIFAAFNTHTPGCAVGVAQRGEVAFTAGYGMADLERSVPITAASVFESGSVAKQFTAAAMMLLAQQGKLSLDDPLRKHLPELHPDAPAVTIRQVISHISGIREWRPLATFGGLPEGTYVYRNEDLLKMAARQRAVNFDPGTNYSYSNTGYNVLPILAERVLSNGQTFQQFTHEAIFAPLGMKHTRWRDDFRAIIPQRALAYVPARDTSWTQLTPIENIFGAGGLLTTVADLLLWNENFTHAKVGGAEFVKAQQTPAVLRNGRAISYAAGLQVTTVDGLREVAHSGSTGGYSTWLARYPDSGVSVAVLCNSSSGNPTALGRATARLWTGAKPTPPPTSTVTVDAAKLRALAGRYRRTRDNTSEDLVLRDGKLRFNEAELVPVGEGAFAMGTAKLTFEPNASRFRVTTLTDDILYERVEPVETFTRQQAAALLGSYASEEAGGAVLVEWDEKAGRLRLRSPSGAVKALRPTFADTFETEPGPASAVHFVRDAAGKVMELSIGEGRVWDLRFRRAAGSR